jgi:hypothetical protein
VKSTFLCPVVLGLAVLLNGCATPYHHSQLVGTRYFKVPINTYPVAVVRVDGESTPLTGPVLVEPGLRRVVLESTTGLPGGLGSQQVLELQVEPCTRYYLVAEKTARFLDRFTPRIDHQEPVPGCTVRPG